ncbi:hypothetical protein TZ00_14815 [Agreia bicolorata]|uniref:Uncharacterized protein n=1 Tax=Agreia bicolorata TaxID=110935 RepID=A0ABR5CCM6_9MICO|nr:hypothetical protein TZ00_14815 [Agreia bicolorata]
MDQPLWWVPSPAPRPLSTTPRTSFRRSALRPSRRTARARSPPPMARSSHPAATQRPFLWEASRRSSPHSSCSTRSRSSQASPAHRSSSPQRTTRAT